MKNKLILLLSLLYVFGCTSDTEVEEQQELNSLEPTNVGIFQNTIEKEAVNPKADSSISDSSRSVDSSTLGDFGGSNQGCGDFVFPIYDPVADGPYFELLDVYYDSSKVSVDEINCIRKKFFEDYPYLRIQEGYLDGDTPFHDVWLIPSHISDPLAGRPGSVQSRKEAVMDAVRNDSRTHL